EREESGERRDEETVGEKAPDTEAGEQQAIIVEPGICGEKRGRKGRCLARRHEADREHPEERRRGDEGDERREQGDGRPAQPHSAPPRFATPSCTSVTARMQRKRRKATAAPDPRFHHLNPSSYMK